MIGMSWKRLYRILQPGTSGSAAQAFRVVHHAMVILGIAIMLADTVASWRQAHDRLLDAGFQLVCAFFIAEYLARLGAAASAPSAHGRGWRARLGWMISGSGLFDLIGALPGVLDLTFSPKYASLYGFVWAFKPVRYSDGLASLGRVISRARDALLSVLLAFGIVLLAAASLAYLLERDAQPKAFGSIPRALWWAIVTLTTTGYGDVTPITPAGRILAGIVMIAGILVFALWAGILASGYAEELRRREFLRTWDLVAKVPFFKNVGASVIADVARLLRARDYPARAVIVRRGATWRLHVFHRFGRSRSASGARDGASRAGRVFRRNRASDRRASQCDNRCHSVLHSLNARYCRFPSPPCPAAGTCPRGQRGGRASARRSRCRQLSGHSCQPHQSSRPACGCG